jgi:hypothetical protein
MVQVMSTTSKVVSFESTASKPSPSPPWWRYVTLDVVLKILGNSVFHPWISLCFYLCLASIHKHREPLAWYTLWWTAFLAVVETAIWVDHRVTYGPSRKVEWDKEVAVVTGGGSGLGRVLAEMLVRKGCKVAVWDVRPPDEEALEAMERWDLVWHQVDVGDEQQVKEATEKVVDEVRYDWFIFAPGDGVTIERQCQVS